MPTTFSGDVGYRGVVKLNNIILLATGANINLSHNIIPSTGVWGAGYQNAAENVAYANNYLNLDGSMACELTAGAGFEAIKTFAFTNRGAANGTPILIQPNGEQGFSGKGWCTSLSFSSSQDAVLTADMNWTSYVDGAENVITTGTNSNSETGASGGVLPMAYNGLYPYWANEIDGFTDIINWSASYSSSVEPLKCCGSGQALKSTAGAPLAPDYLILGSMTAEGNFTVFKLQGDFNPESYHAQKSFKVTVNSPAEPTGGHVIFLPKIVYNSGSSAVQAGNGPITCDFSFTAIGDGVNPPLSLDPVEEDPGEEDPREEGK